nr:helix-turn-helix domain-containing protein [Bacilli bacterium]
MEKQYEIGNLITELRKEKKLTQSKLAEALGVTDKSVSKWENGKSLPDTKIMPRLCEILGISLEELLNGKLNPITESPVLDDLSRLEHVYKYYSDEHRVNVGISDINLALNLGECVAITGPSGSGKTTLLKMIGGIDRFERGEIFIRKEGISHFDEEDYELYRKDFIAYIFQEYGVFENYSLLDNLILVRLLMGDAHKEAKAKALAMLEK